MSESWLRITRFWPLALLALLGGAVYLLLASVFSEALIAEGELPPRMTAHHGGPSALFSLCGGVLGWASVALAARQTSTAGPLLWLISAMGWVSAAAIGFGAALVAGGDPDGVLAGAAAISLVVSAVVAACTTWFTSD